jgi:hypothetical protein
MIRTDEFAKDMSRELAKHYPELEWKPSWCPIKGYEHVDLAGFPKQGKGQTVLIEVELRRSSPVSNVVKIWKWIQGRNFKMRPIVFQAFSAYYENHKTHKEAAAFIGEKMAIACKLRYFPLYFEYKPGKGGKVGAGRRRHHAILLAKRISRKMKRNAG